MRMMMKSLFVGALFPLAAVVAPGAADAAPCSTTAVAYSIWVTPGFSCTITDASLHITGAVFGAGSVATVSESLGNNISLVASIPNMTDVTTTFAGTTSLSIVKDALVLGGTGTNISAIRNDFSQTGVTTPRTQKVTSALIA